MKGIGKGVWRAVQEHELVWIQVVLLVAWVALQWEENCSFWPLLGDLN